MSAPVTTAWDALAERFQSIYENASLLYKIIIKVVICIYIYIYIYIYATTTANERALQGAYWSF